MSYQVMKRHEGSINVYCKIKAANLKKLHSIHFQLVKIIEKQKLWKIQNKQWFPGVDGQRGVNGRGTKDL